MICIITKRFLLTDLQNKTNNISYRYIYAMPEANQSHVDISALPIPSREGIARIVVICVIERIV